MSGLRLPDCDPLGFHLLLAGAPLAGRTAERLASCLPAGTHKGHALCTRPQALYPAYLDRYYSSPPPCPANPPAPAAGAASSNPAPGLPAWAVLEAACAADPLFERFVSPSLHVRAFSPTAILFNVRGWGLQSIACFCVCGGPTTV